MSIPYSICDPSLTDEEFRLRVGQHYSMMGSCRKLTGISGVFVIAVVILAIIFA